MKTIARALLVAFAVGSLAACAEQPMDLQHKVVNLSNGQPVDVIMTQVVSPAGIDTASIAYGLCKPNEKCEFHSSDFGNPGILKSIAPAAMQAAGMVGSAALLRPPQYNSNSLLAIDNQGSSATSGSKSTGGTSVSEAGAGASSASNSGANVTGTNPSCSTCTKSGW